MHSIKRTNSYFTLILKSLVHFKPTFQKKMITRAEKSLRIHYSHVDKPGKLVYYRNKIHYYTIYTVYTHNITLFGNVSERGVCITPTESSPKLHQLIRNMTFRITIGYITLFSLTLNSKTRKLQSIYLNFLFCRINYILTRFLTFTHIWYKRLTILPSYGIN